MYGSIFTYIVSSSSSSSPFRRKKKRKNTFLNVQTRIRYMYKCICEENKCVFVCRDVTANGKRLHDARNIGKHPDMKCMYLMHQHAMPCNSKTKAHTHTALTYMMSRGWNWNFAYIYLVFRLCVILYAGKKLRVANSKQWPLLPNQSRAHKHTHTRMNICKMFFGQNRCVQTISSDDGIQSVADGFRCTVYSVHATHNDSCTRKYSVVLM